MFFSAKKFRRYEGKEAVDSEETSVPFSED
jgi:hypothetical protein